MGWLKRASSLSLNVKGIEGGQVHNVMCSQDSLLPRIAGQEAREE